MLGCEKLNWEIKRFEELSTQGLYDILKARYEVFTVGQKCLYQDCDDRDQYSYHLYLKENEKIVAYLRIVEKGKSYDEVSIGRVMVIESFRGQGLAREMIETAIKFITEQLKEKVIKISAQEYLLDFYKSIGFKQISDVYLEVEIPHIKMIYEA